MFIGTISCSGKCCIESNLPLTTCQNDEWRSCSILSIQNETLCRRYLSNFLTEAIVFGGLEPFEQFDEIYSFICTLRVQFKCYDPIVIYTGYYPREIFYALKQLSEFDNIIIKFGRYIPNQPSKFDSLLGVTLASNNQYCTTAQEAYKQLVNSY